MTEEGRRQGQTIGDDDDDDDDDNDYNDDDDYDDDDDSGPMTLNGRWHSNDAAAAMFAMDAPSPAVDDDPLFDESLRRGAPRMLFLLLLVFCFC